jgi:bacteriocin-like protein
MTKPNDKTGELSVGELSEQELNKVSGGTDGKGPPVDKPKESISLNFTKVEFKYPPN